MRIIYKSITDYKTENGTFTEQHVGTLADNLQAIEATLMNETIVSANTYHKLIKKEFIGDERVFLVDSYEANCRTIDQQFLMGFSSIGIYNSWEDHSAEQQYILDNHFDEDLELYFGHSKL